MKKGLLTALPTLKLRGKILSISAITLVAMCLIGIIFFTQKSAIDRLTATERAQAVQVEGLIDYRSGIEAAAGAIKALVTEPSEANAESVATVMANLTDIRTELTIPDSLSATLDDAAPHIPSLVEKITNLGLTEDLGFQGQLRSSVRAVEGVLNDAREGGMQVDALMVEMLMLRRHEKDFILRLSASYVDRFNQSLADFNQQLAVSAIPAAQKNEISALMATYAEGFATFSAATLDARTELATLLGKADIILNDVKAAEQAATDIRVATSQQLEAQWATFNVILYATILVAAALALGLSLVIGKSIERPVTRLSQVMRQLANGEFRVEVEGRDKTDELGDMARAVEVFRENGLKMEELNAEQATITERDRIRSDAMGRLVASLNEVVGQAARGNFGGRISEQFDDEDLAGVASSVNGLVETVERGLGETGEVLAALAETDLSQRVTGDYEGAFDRLKSDTNAVAEKLTEIVGQLKETSRSLKVATGEILSGANDLSERTTKQAAAIEETSATMDQLATTVLDNAKAAEGASQNAVAVSSAAEEGGEVMGRATEAMQRITSSSAKISNIIGLIDDIAFQTNLLALNASVEAARAGEAGKGFAVVAVEVRRLAQSAAEASSEVKQLIEQSATEVEDGSKLVAIASEKLMNMLQAVKQNADLTRGIAAASREQASSIEEVNAAVRQMDEMTQHNAALVEETNAAIEQTEAQASELDRIVDVFKLTGGHKPAQPVRSANPVAAGIRGLHNKVKAAAQTYLGGGSKTPATHGNAALDREWEEF